MQPGHTSTFTGGPALRDAVHLPGGGDPRASPQPALPLGFLPPPAALEPQHGVPLQPDPG